MSIKQLNRYYSNTSILTGPKKSNKISSVSLDQIEEDSKFQLPNIKTVDNNMDSVLKKLSVEFTKINTGKVSVDMFNNIKVDSFGTVSNCGQVTLKTPTKVSIAVYDPSTVKIVADSIRECGLNLNPTVEGNNLIINIPKPSKESRDNLVKLSSKLSEKVCFVIFVNNTINIKRVNKIFDRYVRTIWTS